MLLDVSDFEKKLIKSRVHNFAFNFLLNGNDLIITDTETIYALISTESILYRTTFDTDIEFKNVFKELIKKESLPENLRDFINERAESKVGQEIEAYGDIGSSCRFCNSEKFAYFYGISNPELVKLRVIEEFNNSADFDRSFNPDDDGKYCFGFWDLEDNVIETAFLFGHPSQTKLCFSDFASYKISTGSRFLKLERI